MARLGKTGTDSGFSFSVFTRLELSGAALQAMLEHPLGPVGQRMLGQAIAIQETAQAHCPVESAESAGRHQTERASQGMPPRHPGRLRDSIDIYRDESSGVALHFLVGSRLPYAARMEFHPTLGGWLRGALHAHATVGAVHGLSGRVRAA